VLNRGREPTFVTQRRKEVTDITLGSPYISTQVGKWYVSDEPSHSDHRYICLEINKVDKPTVMNQNPRKTNWVRYRESLREKFKNGEANNV
jgi:ribosomal protein L24E